MTKRLIFLCVVLLSVYLTEQTHFLAKEHIQEINNVAKTWKVKYIDLHDNIDLYFKFVFAMSFK